jgi:exosortase
MIEPEMNTQVAPVSPEQKVGTGSQSLGRVLMPWLLLAPLVFMWALLIRDLSLVWNNNPQYTFGWSVPFLCAYLIWKALERDSASAEVPAAAADTGLRSARLPLTTGALLAFLWLPIRLVQEANPGWSLGSWAQALVVIGLTLLVLQGLLRRGQNSASSGFAPLVFPICFFLVAVPWPYTLENPMIQWLTRLNTALTVEVLAGIGIPAMPSGNLIELSTGTVGINQACSGIRSLQAVLMVSLFLGELYQLRALRRIVCVLAGFGVAMFCNLCRMLLLCWVAAKQGTHAIDGWHDPAGVTILIVCFFGVWLCASRLTRDRPQGIPDHKQTNPPRTVLPQLIQGLGRCRPILVALTLWLLFVELAVFGWYSHIESNQPAQLEWNISWPVEAAGFSEMPVPDETAEMLCYDQGNQARWVNPDGTRWQLSFFRWAPGKAAGYLAKSHNPLICMPAAGYKTALISPLHFAEIGSLKVPFRVYGFDQPHGRVYVLYLRWEDKARTQSFASDSLSRFNRLQSVWNGRGNGGQQVLSLATWNAATPEQAREKLVRELEKLVQPES